MEGTDQSNGRSQVSSLMPTLLNTAAEAKPTKIKSVYVSVTKFERRKNSAFSFLRSPVDTQVESSNCCDQNLGRCGGSFVKTQPGSLE